jgi:probable HAF family extracellular repeat protein
VNTKKARNAGYLLSVATAFLFLVASSQIVAAASSRYSITELGSFGGTQTWGMGISDRGQVVGYSLLTDPALGGHAFLYSRGTMTDLYPFMISFSSSGVINNSGQIAGITRANGVIVPAVYRNGRVTVLPSLGFNAEGDMTAQAEAINNRGQVVGNSYITGSPYMHAVLWSGRKVIDLGSFGAYSYASSINDSGMIVGTTAYERTSLPGDWLQVPFLYDNGTMIDLGLFGLSYASDINNRGQIIGSTLVDDGNGVRISATLLDHGRIIYLNTLGLQSGAQAINEQGQIVGWFQFQSGTQSYCEPETGQCTEYPVYVEHPFLYENWVMIDLNTLLPSNSGWELQYAWDINNRGQIVGWGLYDGETRAFVLTPHEHSR